MEGDDRVRLCDKCNKNVYNLSQMTTAEANEFLYLTSLNACVNFHRRRDGTIITDNCPVGLRKLRAQYRRIAAAVTTMVSLAQGFLLASVAADSAKSRFENAPNIVRGEPVATDETLRVPRDLGGAPCTVDPPSLKSYRERAERRLIAAMPKHVDVGNAAIALEIGTTGSIKSIKLVNQSPSKQVDNLILESVRKLKFEELPAEFFPPTMPNVGLPIYFECRKALHK
jgi:hypothetical protein